jgi:hypothetical protein
MPSHTPAVKGIINVVGIVAVLAVPFLPKIHFCAECGCRMKSAPFSSMWGGRKEPGIKWTCCNQKCVAVELESVNSREDLR